MYLHFVQKEVQKGSKVTFKLIYVMFLLHFIQIFSNFDSARYISDDLTYTHLCNEKYTDNDSIVTK